MQFEDFYKSLSIQYNHYIIMNIDLKSSKNNIFPTVLWRVGSRGREMSIVFHVFGLFKPHKRRTQTFVVNFQRHAYCITT